jgi:hypothetical protein
MTYFFVDLILDRLLIKPVLEALKCQRIALVLTIVKNAGRVLKPAVLGELTKTCR